LLSVDGKPKRTEQNLIISKFEAEVTNKKNCARGIVLLKLTTDRQSRGLSATSELFVCVGGRLFQQIGASDLSKPAIWIDAGTHAREWIAPATALHVINKVCLHSLTASQHLGNNMSATVIPQKVRLFDMH